MIKQFLSSRYVIECEIGHGGMAIVYLAHEFKHGRQVAIKVLRPEMSTAFGAGRFLREIGIVAPLAHPHQLPWVSGGARSKNW